MLAIVQIDLTLGTEDEIVFGESIIRLRSRKDGQVIVLFAELHQLRTVVLVNGSNLIDEQCYLVLWR